MGSNDVNQNTSPLQIIKYSFMSGSKSYPLERPALLYLRCIQILFDDTLTHLFCLNLQLYIISALQIDCLLPQLLPNLQYTYILSKRLNKFMLSINALFFKKEK